MEYMGEKKSEKLLESFGFNVVRRREVKNENELLASINVIGLPVVMKVSGKKIVHKNEINGVVTGVNTYSTALEEFHRLKKIKGSSGVLIQKELRFDREFLVGIKNTKDFGNVIVFGAGGINTEEKKDVAFRVVPLLKEDAIDMISEVKIMKGLRARHREVIINIIMRVNGFAEKYSDISEMDINPFVLSEGRGVVLDARILFE